MFLGIDQNLSNLFGVLWSSWICMLISIPRFRKFSFIISLNRLFAPFSFSYDTVFHLISHMFFIFSSHFFILFASPSRYQMVFCSSSLILSSTWSSLLSKPYIKFFSSLTVFFIFNFCSHFLTWTYFIHVSICILL